MKERFSIQDANVAWCQTVPLGVCLVKRKFEPVPPKLYRHTRVTQLVDPATNDHVPAGHVLQADAPAAEN